METDDHLHAGDLDAPPDRPRLHSERFARLVGSPATRRFSPRRAAVAVAIGIGSLWGGAFALARCGQALSSWVADRPEHQIPFTAIELIPPAPAYIQSGSAGILESVRLDARHGETISVLGADLEALRVDLSRNPWIEHVRSVRRAYRRLAVEVVYRQPLALVIYPNERDCRVIDRQGVELPVKSLQPVKTAHQDYYLVPGDSSPLVQVCRLGSGLSQRVGLLWKSSDPAVDDLKVAQAVRLARFLRDARPSVPDKGCEAPRFSIHYHSEVVNHPDGTAELIKGLFLRDPDERWVFWGSGPGSEARDEPKAIEKWANLDRFLARHGSLKAQLDSEHFLSLRSERAEILQVQAESKGRVGPDRSGREDRR